MEDVGKGLARDWDSICDCVRVFQFEIVIGKKEFDGSKFCIRQVEIGLTQSPLKSIVYRKEVKIFCPSYIYAKIDLS